MEFIVIVIVTKVLMMMMMTTMISVELEGVFTHRQTDGLKVQVIAVWKKSSPAAAAAAVHLVYFLGCRRC